MVESVIGLDIALYVVFAYLVEKGTQIGGWDQVLLDMCEFLVICFLVLYSTGSEVYKLVWPSWVWYYLLIRCGCMWGFDVCMVLYVAVIVVQARGCICERNPCFVSLYHYVKELMYFHCVNFSFRRLYILTVAWDWGLLHSCCLCCVICQLSSCMMYGKLFLMYESMVFPGILVSMGISFMVQ